MSNVFIISHNYKDILSVSREEDQFVSWFSCSESGIGNSGGIRSARYLNIRADLPAYIVMITRNINHRWYNPWEDTIDYSSGSIFYWGDAKHHEKTSYDGFRGNRHLKNVWEKVLENRRSEIPPILHFSKVKSGLVKFNGLCVLTNLELTWFEDQGKPVKNYRCELSILDEEEVDVAWLHQRVKCEDLKTLNETAPRVWQDYIRGNTRKLDVWSRSIRSRDEQLPPEMSREAQLLSQLSELTPTQFEAVVVELFRNLPHVHHKITRTRPTADGGFDFFGQFAIPYPIHYELEFLGEAKKFARNNPVQPKHVSRLVARLGRGQFGIFVTTSYYTPQTQKEVLQDDYPVRLFSGSDIVNILRELRLTEQDGIKAEWLQAVLKKM
ncbi:restriction endonuclease [Pontibacter mucosus]|uniref:Restriction endonuclease n=1 Tax=Pontibacter mucosus TaxID=1649266 RepID=A0A2T5YDU6_9BACT|nr:restriction endonuclease [Pontibacter mucosus]PTX14723.1 restriction endonuclease [Pontibacter mucosus]